MRDDMNRRDFSKRLGKVVGGLVLAVIGVPLLILPGSGMVLILIGVGFVGQGSVSTCGGGCRGRRKSS